MPLRTKMQRQSLITILMQGCLSHALLIPFSGDVNHHLLVGKSSPAPQLGETQITGVHVSRHRRAEMLKEMLSVTCPAIWKGD